MALFGQDKDEFSPGKVTGDRGDVRDRILERLAFDSLEERRKTRRWNIFFKSLVALYVLAFLVMFAIRTSDMGIGGVKGAHTAMIEMNGTIEDGGEINADDAIRGLRAAFKNADAKAVVMRINSPGGSPVQSAQIFDEVKRLREKWPDKKAYAVLGDICASGGYFIAASADEIYANRSSLVGSIGVIMNGFGFTGTMEKLGVDRRLVTAGENKALLDPFSAQKESDVAHARKLVLDIHEQFKDAVREGRGDRLKEDDEIFSGLVWTGVQAKEIGLVDGFGDIRHVASEVVDAPKVVDYTPRPRLLEQITGGLGVAFGRTIQSLATPTIELR